MQVFEGIDAFDKPTAGVVMTIGNFDGVHLGHRQMIHVAREAAEAANVPLVVMTFEPHPIAVLHPEKAPERLTVHEEKLAILEQNGVDAVIVVRSALDFFALEPREFLKVLVDRCDPKVIVEGPTFFFGRNREGNVDTLRGAADDFGFDVKIVNRVYANELPYEPVVNSSAIRNALLEGRVDVAHVMLGRPHRIVGVVGHGEGRGAKLGIPTVNLEQIPQLLPVQAVYGAVAQLEDGELHLAGVNVGRQPTFQGDQIRVEAHLLGFDGNLRGRRVGLHFIEKLRAQTPFEDAESLIAQVRKDLEHIEKLEPVRERLASSKLIQV